MPDTAAAKSRLETQLAELQARLANLAADLTEEAEKDWEERATQLEDDEAVSGQAALVRQEIASTERALERIAAGTYGECVSCGSEIAEGRLNVRPEASLCMACASR